jgi:hypothetical protein
MKKLLIAIALALMSGVASAESRAEFAKRMFNEEAKRRGDVANWVVKDTGEKAEINGSMNDLVIISKPERPHECLVAVHPTEELFAIIGCSPKEEESESPKQGS